MMLADDEAVIGEWLSRDGAFVCYREPGARVCRGLRAAPDALQPFEDISLLDGKSGFVFAPFRVGREHPLWLLPGGDEMSVALSRASCSGEVEAPAPVPFVGERQAQPTEAYIRAHSSHVFNNIHPMDVFEQEIRDWWKEREQQGWASPVRRFW